MYYLQEIPEKPKPLTDEELALYPHRNDDPFILRIRADQIAIDALTAERDHLQDRLDELLPPLTPAILRR
jgi:hypothetical protein